MSHARRRRAAIRVLAVTALAGAVLAIAVSGVLAATEVDYDPSRVESADPQATGRWGERAATVRDLNGDRVNEILLASLSHTVGALNNAGRVYMLNGADRRVLYSIDSPEPQANASFGFFIQVPGDLNGDGKDDFVAGTDAQDVGGNVDQGKAWAFSGTDGRLLYGLDNPAPQGTAANRARFGSRIGTAGDVNADRVPDVIVGASGNDSPAGCANTTPVPVGCRRDQGQAFIFNGRNGALIRTLNLPSEDQQPATCSSNCGSLGLAVQGPGDVDGDGVVDQLVDASNYNGGQGRMYLFSGRSGAVLSRIDDPEPDSNATFGFQDAAPLSPGDVNGDGRADLYANGFGQDGPAGESQGKAWVFDGRQSASTGRGVLLYELRDPTPSRGGQFGWSLDRTDYNRDGRPDLYVGSSPHHVAGTDQNGGTYVFNGRDGSLLKALEIPASERQMGGTDLGPNLGWGLAAPGDLNNDGQPDYIGGAPFYNIAPNDDQGRVYVFLSRLAAGRCKTEVLGTSGPDSLTGTRAGDRLVGLAHNDRLIALEGADCLLGNSGNDLLVGGSGNDRILGAAGRDRLSGGAGRDSIVGGPGVNRYSGGSGNDKIEAANGRTERVNCGRGRDTVRADNGDRLTGCERVKETRLVRR